MTIVVLAGVLSSRYYLLGYLTTCTLSPNKFTLALSLLIDAGVDILAIGVNFFPAPHFEQLISFPVFRGFSRTFRGFAVSGMGTVRPLWSEVLLYRS